MPGTTLPATPHWVPAPITKQDLDWADLAIIDFSEARTPEGRAKLAPQVRDVMRTVGFLCVVNHGVAQAQTDRIFDIGNVPFTQVSEEEMKQYTAKIAEEGSKIGYKPRQLWTIENGVRDQHEQYAWNPSVYSQRQHPKALQPFLPELRAFAEHNITTLCILFYITYLISVQRILAIGMELPEDTFVKIHEFNAISGSHTRFIKYHPRTQEEELKTKNVWLKGHADTGSVTVLWSQPVSGLQIMSPDGKWRWVRHIDNALVVNVGYTIEILSGGFYKGTIHRVVQPPADQRGYARLGAYYFSLPNDDVRLLPFTESPVLQRVGIERKCEDKDAPTMGDWRKERTMSYGLRDTTRKDDGNEEQIVNGVVVKYYN